MTQKQLDKGDLLAQLNEAEQPIHGGARRWLVWTPIFLALFVLLGLLGWGLIRQRGAVSNFGVNDGPAAVKMLNRPAADFSGQLYEPFQGESEFRLSAYRGQVVVVNFWASWCPPCREEAPLLEQTWRKYKEQGVLFIGINIWDTEQGARAYMEEFDITFPNLVDERGRIAVEYGVTGIPETFFITPTGMISRKVIGAINRTTLEQNIQEAIRVGEEGD